MPPVKSHLEIYKLLPQTNCRQCGLASCLAFAVAVMQRQRPLADCPPLGPEAQADLEMAPQTANPLAQDQERALEQLREQVAGLDLQAAAARVGGRWQDGRLLVSCLGKDFAVDQRGLITSDIHVNPWVSGPLYRYLLGSTGRPPQGTWLPLRDLPGGADWWRLFGQRCEKPLKRVVDGYTALLQDLVVIFAGRPAPASFDSDIAVVLNPLPLLPMLLCYWRPEDGMESDLHLFFDATAEENLAIEAIYTLGVGLVTMFEKITRTHGR